MKVKFVLVAGVVLSVASLSAQASELRVKGAIVPASCSFTMTNAVFDYGDIRPSSLSETQYTRLTAKSTPFAVKCEGSALTAVGLKAVDNRSSSKVPGIVSSIDQGYTDNYNYGLGVSSKGQKIGGYAVHVQNSIADGRTVRTVTSADNGNTWTNYRSNALGQGGDVIAWWGGSGAQTPLKVNSVSGNIQIITFINKKSALDVGSKIELDGHATLELRYL